MYILSPIDILWAIFINWLYHISLKAIMVEPNLHNPTGTEKSYQPNNQLIWDQLSVVCYGFVTYPWYRYVKYTYMWNVHMHRNPKNTWNIDDSLGSGTKLLLPSWLLGFQHRERERDTQFLLCWLFPLIPTRTAHLVDPTGLASPRFENQLASSRFKSQLTAFFQKSPKIFSLSLSGMTSFTSPVLFPIWFFLLWHLWLSHPPRTSVNTCAQCVLLPVH